MEEVWKPISGYEGVYEISNHGRIRNKHKVLKWGYTGNKYVKYPRIGLYKNNKQKSRLIHILVLEAFVGPKPEGMQARHIDGNSHNPRVDNLAWGTIQENADDRRKHGTHPPPEQAPVVKLNMNKAREIRGSNLSAQELADRYGVCFSSIYRVLKNKRWREHDNPAKE